MMEKLTISGVHSGGTSASREAHELTIQMNMSIFTEGHNTGLATWWAFMTAHRCKAVKVMVSLGDHLLANSWLWPLLGNMILTV